LSLPSGSTRKTTRPLAILTQLLYPQYFASNPFIFIDLAGTPSTRPNQFMDLRENAIFFQE